MNRQRYDNRSEEEFKKDIADKTLIERQLFLKWIDVQERDTGIKIIFTNTGCGNHGEFMESKDVSLDADFHVEGVGPIEVKFSKPILKKDFHLKVGQVKSYIKQNASILMVMGAEEEVPKFTILCPKTLQDIVNTCKTVSWIGFGFKPAYRISVKNFIWRDLK